MSAAMPTFISLTREFGGTRFGPYDGTYVSLGSDPQQCHVVLPAELGVYAVHLWISPGEDGTFVLQPADTRAPVFSHAMGTPMPVEGAARLNSGQAFSLVAPDGPKFVLEYAPAGANAQAQFGRGVQAAAQGQSHGHGGRQQGGRGRTLGGRGLPSAGDFAREAKRQAGVSLMTTGPLAQFSHLFYRLRSGALLQPRYIIAGLVGLGGIFFTACSGLAAFLHLN
jgi:hypothetical protein